MRRSHVKNRRECERHWLNLWNFPQKKAASVSRCVNTCGCVVALAPMWFPCSSANVHIFCHLCEILIFDNNVPSLFTWLIFLLLPNTFWISTFMRSDYHNERQFKGHFPWWVRCFSCISAISADIIEQNWHQKFVLFFLLVFLFRWKMEKTNKKISNCLSLKANNCHWGKKNRDKTLYWFQ